MAVHGYPSDPSPGHEAPPFNLAAGQMRGIATGRLNIPRRWYTPRAAPTLCQGWPDEGLTGPAKLGVRTPSSNRPRRGEKRQMARRSRSTTTKTARPYRHPESQLTLRPDVDRLAKKVSDVPNLIDEALAPLSSSPTPASS